MGPSTCPLRLPIANRRDSALRLSVCAGGMYRTGELRATDGGQAQGAVPTEISYGL